MRAKRMIGILRETVEAVLEAGSAAVSQLRRRRGTATACQASSSPAATRTPYKANSDAIQETRGCWCFARATAKCGRHEARASASTQEYSRSPFSSSAESLSDCGTRSSSQGPAGRTSRASATSCEEGSSEAIVEAELPECTVIKRLGKGTQGIVDLVSLERDGHESMAARKLVKKFRGALSDISQDMYQREFRGLCAGAGSKHVCQLLASSATSTPGHLTFLLEYFKGTLEKNLIAARRDLREPGMLVSEGDLSVIGASLLLGLRDLHSKGCVHRDLKPANIFLSAEGRVAIGDFDNCEFVDTAGAVYGTAGTHPYQAPEIPRSFEVEKEQPYSMPADIYSLGVVLSECAMGCDWLTWQGYISGIFRDVPSFVPATLVSLLEGLLECDPTKRLTVEGAMRHPFFATIDFENDI